MLAKPGEVPGRGGGLGAMTGDGAETRGGNAGGVVGALAIGGTETGDGAKGARDTGGGVGAGADTGGGTAGGVEAAAAAADFTGGIEGDGVNGAWVGAAGRDDGGVTGIRARGGGAET